MQAKFTRAQNDEEAKEAGKTGGKSRCPERSRGAGKGEEKKEREEEGGREERDRETEGGFKAASVCDETSLPPLVPTNMYFRYKLPFQTKAESRTHTHHSFLKARM